MRIESLVLFLLINTIKSQVTQTNTIKPPQLPAVELDFMIQSTDTRPNNLKCVDKNTGGISRGSCNDGDDGQYWYIKDIQDDGLYFKLKISTTFTAEYTYTWGTQETVEVEQKITKTYSCLAGDCCRITIGIYEEEVNIPYTMVWQSIDDGTLFETEGKWKGVLQWGGYFQKIDTTGDPNCT
eukprot:UN09886